MKKRINSNNDLVASKKRKRDKIEREDDDDEDIKQEIKKEKKLKTEIKKQQEIKQENKQEFKKQDKIKKPKKPKKTKQVVIKKEKIKEEDREYDDDSDKNEDNEYEDDENDFDDVDDRHFNFKKQKITHVFTPSSPIMQTPRKTTTISLPPTPRFFSPSPIRRQEDYPYDVIEFELPPLETYLNFDSDFLLYNTNSYMEMYPNTPRSKFLRTPSKTPNVYSPSRILSKSPILKSKFNMIGTNLPNILRKRKFPMQLNTPKSNQKKCYFSFSRSIYSFKSICTTKKFDHFI